MEHLKTDWIWFALGLLIIVFLLTGCYALGSPMGMGDLEEISKTHCINSTFRIAGPPPGGVLEGTITPRLPDGSCK